MKLKTVMLATAAVCAAQASYAKGGFFRQLVNQTVENIVAPPPPPPPPPQTIVVQQPVVQQPVYVQQPVVQQPIVQQPVVQQPVVQQVQQPVAAAAPSPAASVAAPAVDAAAFANARTAAAETAAPTFKYGTLTFEKPATPEQIAAVAPQIRPSTRLSLAFKGTVDNETVAAAVARFPQAVRLSLDGSKGSVSSIAPLALLRSAENVALVHLDGLDLTPIAGLPKVVKLEIRYCQVADLAPVATLPALKELDAYGAELVSFAPLAAAPRLETVGFYAAKLSPEGYESLGTLKQVRNFHGGLTKMTSLAWCRNVPQAEELKIFAEKIPDLTPIAALPNLRYFRGWNMKGDNLSTDLGDLSFLANAANLEKLELPGSRYSSTAVLANLPKVRTLDLSGSKLPLDLSFVRHMPSLTSLNISGTSRDVVQIANFEALAGHPSLESLTMLDTTGPTSLAALQSCPKLKSVHVRKGVFPAEDVAALQAALQARGKWNKVSER
ncbi:MAG: leucine-rich repeat domain-containing protein [Kiritimatiellia bacterium]